VKLIIGPGEAGPDRYTMLQSGVLLTFAMTARWITSPLLTLAINLFALDMMLRNIIVFASVDSVRLL
jgi:hypothetical protein